MAWAAINEKKLRHLSFQSWKHLWCLHFPSDARCHARGINTFWIPGDLLMYMYSYWIQSHWPRTFFTYMYSYLLQGKWMQKARGTCIEFKIDGAQKFSRMCMCIEFVIQVPKQKNACSFPVGMVSHQIVTCLLQCTVVLQTTLKTQSTKKKEKWGIPHFFKGCL